MIIVNVQQIRKYHAANLVLDGVTFQLRESEKVALIGGNGSGKSTLLRILSGHEPIDGGSLSVKKELQIGYLPQIPAEFERMTVYEVLAHGFREQLRLKQELNRLEDRMASQDAAASPGLLSRLLIEYTEARERFEQGDGYEMDTSIDQVTSGLSIDRNRDDRPFGSLSGGEKSRVVLASQLATRPGLLLLDEPTNHLDLPGVEWLEQYLRRYDGACLIVSHDRYFLDAVSSKTIELEDGEAQLYLTGYSGYVREKEEKLLQQFSLYQEQQKQIKKMKETIRQLEEWGRIGGNEKFYKRAASIRKALERMETVKRPAMEKKTAEFALNPTDRSGNRVIEFEGLSKRYGNQALLKAADGALAYGEKVALIGANGSGKTTLFKLLLGELEGDAGQIKQGSRVEIGYLAQQEPIPDPKLTVLDYFRTEGGYEEGEARGTLARYLFYGADVFKSLQSLSGGEWSRLRLALLVRKKPNLLLLDEPTNHLDIASREALEEALEEYPGTVLAISHDRYFINRLAKKVWELQDGALSSYLGNYDDYVHQLHKLASFKKEMPRESKKPQEKITSTAAREAYDTGVLLNLEKDIQALEEELALLDEAINRLSDSGATSELEAGWQKREELRSRIEDRMTRWMELQS